MPEGSNRGEVGSEVVARKRAYGVYYIFKSMEQGPTFRVSVPKYPTKDPHHRILAPQRSRFTHYYFYIRDEPLGPMVMRVASFFPFQTTYYLNGHSFIEQELKRAQIGFRKSDNAFLAVDDVAALQAAADRLSPEIIRKRLDYWTLILGPKFSAKERKQLNLSRFYAISQIEYCRNFIFKRNFPIHKLFERSCELGLWRLTANKIAEIFGTRLHRRHRGKLATVIDQIEHGHHVFRTYSKSAFLKQYARFSSMAALTSADGLPTRSTRPSSPPSISPIKVTVSTNSATTCASSGGTGLSSVTDPATPTASPSRVSRSRCCFYSSTNVCAD